MVKLEVDGREVEVPEGSMVMHATNALDIYVPHFCYHKKLSIAANCRMCLVEVDKVPKPLPACATPVTSGMKVFTRSEKALVAQRGVMEFLLINHPLDCPICDQGGECQLQDLSVGYGDPASTFVEAKRVVSAKEMGPLISAREMTRCIHCTRCVRFGQEVAGIMEIGMSGRGEHSEIESFLDQSVESELSGNVIDLCPVGALTSKPFRFSARTWELSRRKSIAAHDSLGSNIIVQVKSGVVKRVVPLENEAINECWLSDRDRFAYEGLNSPDRLLAPMIKQDGQWRTVDWQTALDYAAHALRTVRDQHGGPAIGALASGQSTVEELGLLARLVRALGSGNVDFRLRQTDFSLDGHDAGVPWLGMPIADIGTLDRLLLVGSTLRKDQPLLAARVRAAVKLGAQVSILHAVGDDLLMPVANTLLARPSQWVGRLEAILQQLRTSGRDTGDDKGSTPGSSADGGSRQGEPDSAQAIADSLRSGKSGAVLLGASAARHPQAARLANLAAQIAGLTGARFGWLPEAANTVGGYLVGATAQGEGALNARQMVEQPRSAYLLLNVEPSLDHGAPGAARTALRAAESVIALSVYQSPELLDLADCLLPIAPFTETAGTFVNAEGRVQSFNGVARPAGECRPAWKVLRVLGNLLELTGFGQDSAQAVRQDVLPAQVADRMAQVAGAGAAAAAPAGAAPSPSTQAGPGDRPSGDTGGDAAGLELLAEVPIYAVDPIVRRAESLQRTTDAAAPRARVHPATLRALGLADGAKVRVMTDAGEGQAQVEIAADPTVAEGVLRLAAAHASTAELAAAGGLARIVRASGEGAR